MKTTIASRADFERVYRQGRRYNHPLMRLVVLCSTCKGDPGRVAFAAPKRIGHAVWRNRSKRVLRETARACGLPAEGYDLILFATPHTGSASPQELVNALSSLCARAGVIHA